MKQAFRRVLNMKLVTNNFDEEAGVSRMNKKLVTLLIVAYTIGFLLNVIY
jgi:hypothetical protein